MYEILIQHLRMLFHSNLQIFAQNQGKLSTAFHSQIPSKNKFAPTPEPNKIMSVRIV